MFIFLCLCSFPFAIKTLFTCPINIGQNYHYPKAFKDIDYLHIRINRTNIKIFDNETITIQPTINNFNNSTNLISNKFRTIYRTNRIIKIIDNDSTVTYKFTVFTHDNSRLSVFILMIMIFM